MVSGSRPCEVVDCLKRIWESGVGGEASGRMKSDVFFSAVVASRDFADEEIDGKIRHTRKDRKRQKTDETPYVDTQARGVWICLQVLKIALEAVKSRINRRDQLWKSSKGMVGWGIWAIFGGFGHWKNPLSHGDSNHIQPWKMGSFAIEEFWTLSL